MDFRDGIGPFLLMVLMFAFVAAVAKINDCEERTKEDACRRRGGTVVARGSDSWKCVPPTAAEAP